MALKAWLFLAAFALSATVADAAELMMYRRAGCPWCAAWDREVGPIYRRTELGGRLALRFVELDRRADQTIQLAGPIKYTPTFVLIEAQREVGRIEGYPGADFFWGLLEGLARRLPQQQALTPLSRGDSRRGIVQ
jgi:hypothetical protein